MQRRSRYRDSLQETLRRAPGPLSAAEVHRRLCDTGVGLATVYRLLNEGLEQGALVGVDLPGGPRRFEPAGLPRHHHFECRSCRQVTSVMGQPSGLERLAPEGFTVERQEVILFGRCPDCAEKAQEKVQDAHL
ncbi:MAG: transcriptional repressor [Planctomycetota bacterium]